jgi:bifunctional non-homologous end joining protein LigD
MARDETHVEVDGDQVRISSPGKIMFPEQGWTKLDLVQHYVTPS